MYFVCFSQGAAKPNVSPLLISLYVSLKSESHCIVYSQALIAAPTSAALTQPARP